MTNLLKANFLNRICQFNNGKELEKYHPKFFKIFDIINGPFFDLNKGNVIVYLFYFLPSFLKTKMSLTAFNIKFRMKKNVQTLETTTA